MGTAFKWQKKKKKKNIQPVKSWKYETVRDNVAVIAFTDLELLCYTTQSDVPEFPARQITYGDVYSW